VTDNEYIKSIIKSLDDDLVRAQYDLAIYVTARTDSKEIKPTITKKLRTDSRLAGNRIAIFNHIDLIIQQDAVQTICRMMDKRSDVKSFHVLINKANSSQDKLLESAKNQYQRAETNPTHKALQNALVEERIVAIKKFIEIENELRNSDDFKKLKHLRDEVLAHRSKKPRSSKAHIEMVFNCLEKLEELLSLSYLIFLETDYRTRTGYKFAQKHATNFWQLTFDIED